MAQLTFRQLHESGCFVIPNPWDMGSARILASLGFKALASTSAGYAFSRGLPDEVNALSVDDVLDHLRELVSATALPVNAPLRHECLLENRWKGCCRNSQLEQVLLLVNARR